MLKGKTWFEMKTIRLINDLAHEASVLNLSVTGKMKKGGSDPRKLRKMAHFHRVFSIVSNV